MAYTGHGHQIMGSPQTGTPPKQKSRCGGEYLCTACLADGQRWRKKHTKKES